MITVAEIQECISGLIYLAVGIHLLQLSRRTQRFPEWLLSLSFLLWGANYLVYDIPYMLLEESVAVPFYFVARLALDVGNFLFVVFIWKVFRSEDPWGGWLVTGITALLLAGLGGSVWVGDWEGMLPISDPWFWPTWLAGLLAAAWMTVEGLHHYRRSRQRHRMGLCEAMTCDRFQLWAIAGGIWFALQWVVIYQYVEYEIARQWGIFVGVFVGMLEIVPALVISLVFFPPAFYRSWVERRYAAA